MIIIDIIVWLLIIVGTLAGLLLVMPIDYRAEGAVDDDGLWWHLRLGWAFGFLSAQVEDGEAVLRVAWIPVWRKRLSDLDEEPKKEKKPKKKEKKPKDEGKGKRGLFWFLQRRELLAEIFGRYVRSLHLSGGVEGVIGLSDPDATAKLYDLLVVMDAKLPEGMLDVELDWVEEVTDLYARLGGWIWPAQVVGISLALWLDRETWDALRAV